MRDKGVIVLAVSVDADKNNYAQFLKEHSVTLLTVRDADQKSNDLYGTFKFPETYIIDRNGTVRRKFIGPVEWNQTDILDYLSKPQPQSPRRERYPVSLTLCGLSR